MVEKAFLPKNLLGSGMKAFPIADNPAHGLIAGKRQDCVDMIRHYQEQSDVPTAFGIIKLSGLK
jgi:hypothetical protein